MPGSFADDQTSHPAQKNERIAALKRHRMLDTVAEPRCANR